MFFSHVTRLLEVHGFRPLDGTEDNRKKKWRARNSTRADRPSPLENPAIGGEREKKKKRAERDAKNLRIPSSFARESRFHASLGLTT